MKKKTEQELLFINDVSSESIEKLIKKIVTEQKAQPQIKFKILLHSNGGDFVAAMAFYNFIKRKKIKIDIHVIGDCNSAALLFLCAAEKRTAAKTANFLLHSPRLTVSESDYSPSELQKQIRSISGDEKNFITLLRRHSKMPAAQLKLMFEKETWLNAEEAFNYGLLTEKPSRH